MGPETRDVKKETASRPVLLTNAALYAPEPLGLGSVLVEGNKIAALHLASVLSPGTSLPGVESIDLSGAALGPGLIDLHTHGAAGVDLMDGGDAVARMARFFARHGVTGFFPTTVTASWPVVKRAIHCVRAAFCLSL